MPALIHFEDKITDLKAIKNEIDDVSASLDVNYLRINVSPLKKAINTLLTLWIEEWTGFLLNNVKTRIRNIREFTNIVQDGMQKNPVD